LDRAYIGGAGDQNSKFGVGDSYICISSRMLCHLSSICTLENVPRSFQILDNDLARDELYRSTNALSYVVDFRNFYGSYRQSTWFQKMIWY
jgi:hypothetical protein